MDSESRRSMPIDTVVEEAPIEERGDQRLRQRIEFLSAVLLAVATVATAWSAYQSAGWGGESHSHQLKAVAAIVRTAKFTNLAEQKLALHAGLFGPWMRAIITDDKRVADFLFGRFPEPLKAATVAWQATQPLTNSSAPAMPFNMPEYVLTENLEAQHWEEVSIQESGAAETANELSDRYLLFTVIFASVLFFGGISGKFGWQAMDVTVLVFGALALVIGLSVMFQLPIQ